MAIHRLYSLRAVALASVVCLWLALPSLCDFDDDDLPKPMAAGLAAFSHAIFSVRLTTKDGKRLLVTCDRSLPLADGALLLVSLTDGSCRLAKAVTEDAIALVEACDEVCDVEAETEETTVPSERIKRAYRVVECSRALDSNS